MSFRIVADHEQKLDEWRSGIAVSNEYALVEDTSEETVPPPSKAPDILSPRLKTSAGFGFGAEEESPLMVPVPVVEQRMLSEPSPLPIAGKRVASASLMVFDVAIKSLHLIRALEKWFERVLVIKGDQMVT